MNQSIYEVVPLNPLSTCFPLVLQKMATDILSYLAKEEVNG
jgi:hypothetical protein